MMLIVNDCLVHYLMLSLLAVAFSSEVTAFSKNVTADYGDNVILYCTVMSLGSDVSVTWSSPDNNSPLNSFITSTGKNEYNGTLMLTSVTLESAGVYTCSVETDLGNDSESISVIVTGL